MFADTIDDDLDDIPAPRASVWDDDAISIGVGTTVFIADHGIPECVETFENSQITRWPERFDRFYFQTEHGPLLVDVLDDFDGRVNESRAAKHCAFKEKWCAANGRKYFAIGESDVTPDKIRRLVAGGSEPKVSQPASQRKQTQGKRGQISRPKADADA